MTRQEAIDRFFAVLTNALRDSGEISQAMRDLDSLGVHVESVSIAANVTVAQTSPRENDADFLRKLRIAPDLEVRE